MMKLALLSSALSLVHAMKFHGIEAQVDFLGDLHPKARKCDCKLCHKVKIEYGYATTQDPADMPTDHIAMYGNMFVGPGEDAWDGKVPRIPMVAEGCVHPEVRQVRFGPFTSPPGQWHWINSSQIDGAIMWPGDRIKAFNGHLVTPAGEPIAVPPIHAHHIHIGERVSLDQTDFHLWETHGDFAIDPTYGIGTKQTSSLAYQKHLPKGYSAPVHKESRIWVYSVINDVRTWHEGAKHAAVNIKGEQVTGGQAMMVPEHSYAGPMSKADAFEWVSQAFPDSTKTDAEKSDAFDVADQDLSGTIDPTEITLFQKALSLVSRSEWLTEAGVDATAQHKMHGLVDIPFYIEVAFAIETDLKNNTDVFAFDFRNPWGCSVWGRTWKQHDAFYRVPSPNWPSVIIYVLKMPISGKIVGPYWTHNHHLRSYAHVVVAGELPNTRSTCSNLGIKLVSNESAMANPLDGIDFHSTPNIRESYDALINYPGHPVVCKTDPDKPGSVQIWTNAAEGIKPGTQFDRALVLDCVDGFPFKKGDAFTNAFFIAPMFEPEIEVVGMHMDLWLYIAPTEDVVMDWGPGILKPILDDCALTCGNGPIPAMTREQLDGLDFYAPAFGALELGYHGVKADSPRKAMSGNAAFLGLTAVAAVLMVVAGLVRFSAKAAPLQPGQLV